jgi:hypothetical protein
MPNAISPIPKSVTAARAAPSTQRRTKALISKTMRSKKFCA